MTTVTLPKFVIALGLFIALLGLGLYLLFRPQPMPVYYVCEKKESDAKLSIKTEKEPISYQYICQQ